jgi:predicted dehydrogenase
LANPGTSIDVVWVENPERGAEKANAIGARFEPDLDAVLADPAIDGVIVTTATSEHHRVMTAAARAGKHIFTEKVIAATERETSEVLDAVDRAGVIKMV